MGECEKIEFDRLVDWVEGNLSEEEARSVEERVARADDETKAAVDWLRAFVDVGEETVLASPPPEVRSTLMERFEAYAEGRRQPGLLTRLAATLTFDSGLQPAFGVRSAGEQTMQRQLAYSTDIADIVLNLRPGLGGALTIGGQILLNNEDGPCSFAVQLLDNGTEVATTTTDESGEFSFEGVVPGVYGLLASNDRVEIQLPSIDLCL